MRASGIRSDAKEYLGYKHRLYDYKTELPAFPNRLCSRSSPNAIWSIWNMELIRPGISGYKVVLQKIGAERTFLMTRTIISNIQIINLFLLIRVLMERKMTFALFLRIKRPSERRPIYDKKLSMPIYKQIDEYKRYFLEERCVFGR